MITCVCHGVNHTTLIQSIASGKLSPALPLSDLSSQLRAGSDCGTCIPDLHKLIAQHSSSEFMQSAKRIHRSDRRFLLFADQKALQHVDLSPMMQRSYVFVNGTSTLSEVQNESTVTAPLNLFGLGLDQSRRIYLNEKEMPLPDWLLSIDVRAPFSSWEKINHGEFRKWNPDKINRTALMRFLASELTFARRIVEMPELAGVISLEAPEGEMDSSQPNRMLGLPRHNYSVLTGFDSKKWLKDVLGIMSA